MAAAATTTMPAFQVVPAAENIPAILHGVIDVLDGFLPLIFAGQGQYVLGAAFPDSVFQSPANGFDQA